MAPEILKILPLPTDTKLSEIEDIRQEYRYRDGHWTREMRLFGLTPESTVNDVRNTAIALRTANINFGVNAETTKAIQALLALTGDCQDDREFNAFFLRACSFERIDALRRSEQ